MASPRERQLELRLTNLLLACRNALRDWQQIRPRAALRGTVDDTQRWLREDAARPAPGPTPGPAPDAPPPAGRLPYRDD